jgi:biotin transporter BioY
MTVLALLGPTALYLLYAWLMSAIVCAYLSDRKGYGEKPGLASGLLLHAVGVVVWLVWPARAGSRWKEDGPIPRRSRGSGG